MVSETDVIRIMRETGNNALADEMERGHLASIKDDGTLQACIDALSNRGSEEPA
jgi:hypothetical protein